MIRVGVAYGSDGEVLVNGARAGRVLIWAVDNTAKP